MVGNQPDVVYAQALCRGDISPSACKDCVDKASQEVFRDCRSSEAIIWFESCQVHYSSSRFFNSYTYTGKFPPYNDGKKSLTNPNDISPVLGDLFRILSNQSAHNLSRHMFAVGQTQVSGDAIYGLVQCTRDISAEELKTCCFSRQGGMILSRNCYQRFENFRFYNLSAVDEIIIVIPKRRSTATAWKVVVPAVLAVVSLVVLAGFCILWCRRKKNRPEGMHRYERSQSALMGSFVRPQGVAINEEGKELEFVDSLMPEPYPVSEVIRCMHIGVLCVQENPADRPIMSYVVSVLSREATTLPEPSKPAVSVGRHVNYDQLFTADCSVNELTMSSISAR
ncbi:hypothetical protein Ancab_033612 [Ancistrocladus abbreviatus]